MDIRKIKKLIELLEESGIAELEIKEGEESVRISRQMPGYAQPMQAAMPMAPQPQTMSAPAAAPVEIAEPERAVEHDFLGCVDAVLATRADRVFAIALVTLVVPVTAMPRRHTRIVFLDAPDQFVEQAILKPLDGRELCGRVRRFSSEIRQYIRVLTGVIP